MKRRDKRGYRFSKGFVKKIKHHIPRHHLRLSIKTFIVTNNPNVEIPKENQTKGDQMKSNFTALIALLIPVVSFLAWQPSHAATAPKCSAPQTLSMVRNIFTRQIPASQGLTDQELEEIIKIEYPRASSYDDTVKKYCCEAIIKAGTNLRPVNFTYESQLDDQDRHIVSIGGINRFEYDIIKDCIADEINKAIAQKTTTTTTSTTSTTTTTTTTSLPPTTTTTTTPPAATSETKSKTEWKPSFDCAKASNFAEKMICSNLLLGQLDGILSQNYRGIFAANIGDGGRDDLKKTQKEWLLERNKCSDIQCLIDSYSNRIEIICTEYGVISGVHPGCVSIDEIE